MEGGEVMQIETKPFELRCIGNYRRTDCGECGRRRMCCVYHVWFRAWVGTKPYRKTTTGINMGNLCGECAEKIKEEVQ